MSAEAQEFSFSSLFNNSSYSIIRYKVSKQYMKTIIAFAYY